MITLTLAGCELTQPASRQEYALVAVNGQPLPFVQFTGVGVGNGTRLRALRSDGTITLFMSGRFLWQGGLRYEFDGVEDPEFPPSHEHIIGPFRRSSDTTFNLDNIFRARIDADRRRIYLTDQTGAFNGATYEFLRQ